MRCKQVQFELSNWLGRNGIPIPDNLRDHLKSCHECSEYYNEIMLLSTALSVPDWEVNPGELDDITFENIIPSGGKSSLGRRIPARGWRLGWALAPLALVAVIAAVISFLNFGPKPVSVFIGNTESMVSEQDIIGQIATNDTLPDQVMTSLARDDKFLDYADEEILDQADVDQILESMTDYELQALYKKIDKLKG